MFTGDPAYQASRMGRQGATRDLKLTNLKTQELKGTLTGHHLVARHRVPVTGKCQRLFH